MRRFPASLAFALVAAFGIASGHARATSRDTVPANTSVTLIHAGSAPRAPLRYRYRAGDSVEMRMDMTMSMGMELGGRVIPPQTMPTMRMTVGLTVRKVSPQGESTIDLLIKDIGLVGTAGFTPAQQQQFTSALGPLKGFRGSLVVSDRGVTKGMTYQTTAGMNAGAQQILQNLSSQMKQLSTPLPKEAVGVGAKWRVIIPMHGPPITMASRIVFHLKALTPAGPSLAMTVDGWAPSQTLAIPGMGRVSARLKALEVAGQGQLTLSLKRPAANGRMTAKQTMDAEIPVAGQSHSMKMLMEVKVDITSK